VSIADIAAMPPGTTGQLVDGRWRVEFPAGSLAVFADALTALTQTARAPVEPPPLKALADRAITWALWADGLAADRFETEGRSELVRMEPAKGGKSVARIQVRDVLMKGRPLFRGTSMVDVGNAVNQAAADPNVSGILLEIDSPGGTVAGTDTLASQIKAARKSKPVWASIDDHGASAAYWIASQADLVYATTKTALVGSIGVVLTMYDESKAAEAAGIKTHVFKTGPLKAAGTPGAPITDDEAAYLQGLVNSHQEAFESAVRSGRNLSAAEMKEVTSGAVFPAPEAKRLRLIDGIRPLRSTIDALAAAR
jgi:signal peptide peptidase SppA